MQVTLDLQNMIILSEQETELRSVATVSCSAD